MFTQKEFEEKSNKKHNYKYDYSLSIYKTSQNKVSIICKEHGVFEQLAGFHMRGGGCSLCSRNRKKTKEIFSKEVENIYGDKIDCSLVEYKNDSIKVKLICKEHGIFEQYPTHLLKNVGCPKCSNLYRMTEKEFIEESNRIHNNKYTYPLEQYKNKNKKIKIICPIHGIFEQLPKHHINGVGCNLCNVSKGEREIGILLSENKINFKKQKTFDGCSHKKKLQYDFYLPEYNTCIEYDGIQHFIPIERFGGEKALKTNKMRDEIKTDFCLKNDIKLIRIKYNEDIKDKLKCLML